MYKTLLLLIVISFIGSTAHAIDIPPEPVVDTTPPTVVSIVPSVPETNAPYTVTLTFSEDVTGFDLSDLENIAPESLTFSDLTIVSPSVYTFSVNGTTGGHRVHLKDGSVADIAGNTFTSTALEAVVRFDAEPPLVNVSNSPSNNSVTSNPVQFEITSFDSSATFTCAFVEGSSLVGATFVPCVRLEGDLTTIYRPTLTTDGVYTFAVIGTDDLGNASTPSVEEGTIITFTYDTTKPDVHIVVPVATPSSNTTPSLSISSSEPVTLNYFGPCGVATPTSLPAGVTTVTFNPLTPGTYSLRRVWLRETEGTALIPVSGDLIKGRDEEDSQLCFFSATDSAGHTIYHSISTFIITEPQAGGGGNGPLSSVTSNSGSTSSTVTMAPSGPQPGDGSRVLFGQSTPPSDTTQFANAGTGRSAGGTTSGSQVQDKPKPKPVAKNIKKPKPVAQKPKEVPPPQIPHPTPAQSQTASASQSAGGLWSWFGYFFGF